MRLDRRGSTWLRVPEPNGWRPGDEFDTPNFGRFRIYGMLHTPMTEEDATRWNVKFDPEGWTATLFIEPVKPSVASPSSPSSRSVLS